MQKQKKSGKLKAAYWSVVGAATALMWSVMPVMAADKTVNIWDRFSAIMRLLLQACNRREQKGT